ncbi:uncharacterized protein METZ01_LOCUS357720, partial [marine metagenome]
LIHHDEIPGFMMAMTMPFILADSLDINRFQIGDSLQFYLIIENKKSIANDFQLLGKGTILESDAMWEDEYTPLDIGEIITNVNLLDLDSNEVSLLRMDGKFKLISYIFTRCPLPNMCPAVIVKNQFLARSFRNEPNIEFILVSFDYAYDTPSILRKTYESLLETNSNMKAYSSTNHLNDLFTLAGQSNVSFWGIDENDIGHTLRSVLIDPEKRLMKAFDGTDWRPESVERDIRNIMRVYNL